MKSILISIKPKWVCKILNGKKTIEIRKTIPKCDLPIDVYIYCTKDDNGLVWDELGKGLVNAKLFPYAEGCAEHNRLLNGKVVAKFTLNKVEEIKATKYKTNGVYCDYQTTKLRQGKICHLSCLNYEELDKYLKGKIGYAWHIDNLVIFDRPKELSEFKLTYDFCKWNCFMCRKQ